MRFTWKGHFWLAVYFQLRSLSHRMFLSSFFRLQILLVFEPSSSRAVVVAQLVEQLLPTQEIRGSNPNIGKVLSNNCALK